MNTKTCKLWGTVLSGVHLLTCPSVLAADIDPVLLGSFSGFRQGRGGVNGFAVEGSYAYVTELAGRLWVIDISDPSSPQPVGEPVSINVAGGSIEVLGGHLYLVGSWVDPMDLQAKTQMEIYALDDPMRPRPIGIFPTTGQAAAFSGNHAYVAGEWFDGQQSNGRLERIDVSDPENPQPAGTFDDVTAGSYQFIAVQDGIAYVTDHPGRFHVIDLHSMEKLNSLEIPGGVWAVHVKGDYAYVNGSDSTGAAAMHLISIRNPAELRVVSSMQAVGPIRTVLGDHAYAAFTIIDVSDPANPRKVGGGRSSISPGAFDLALRSNLAYVLDGSRGLQIFDVGNVANPPRVGRYDTSGWAEDVEVRGDYAYVADGEAGLQVVDISDPGNPWRVEGYDTDGHSLDLAVLGSHLLLADWTGGLLVFDIVDPAHPRLVHRHAPDNALPSGVTVVGSRAYIVGEPSLQVLDFTDPANPVPMGNLNTGERTERVAVAGDYAYLASWFQGLVVVDISDPWNLGAIGSHDTRELARDVAVAGNYAYVADVSNDGPGEGIVIVDIKNPSNPRRVAVYPTSGEGRGVALFEGYAYVADQIDGLDVVDVRDPENPRRVGGNSAFERDGVSRVTVNDKHVFLTRGGYGLAILDLYEPKVHLGLTEGDPETGFHFRIYGPPGLAVSVELSENLLEWTQWTTITLGASPITLWDSNSIAVPVRFYRAVSP